MFYKTGVQMFILNCMTEIKRIQRWFHDECPKLKNTRDLLCSRYSRHGSNKSYDNYKQTRNYSAQITRETEIQFEWDIIDKSTDQPKLFYNYVYTRKK